MANKLNINENTGDGGYTSWSLAGNGDSSTYIDGYFSKAMRKFFATKVKDSGKKDSDNLIGDTIINADLPDPKGNVNYVSIPQIEINRRKRYEEYEKMDNYPEVTAAFDIYADDATQKDLRNNRWTINSENLEVIEEVKYLFRRIKLDRIYWDIVRNVCKFGDCFIETIADPTNMEAGLRRIKILNPNFIIRREDNHGYLKDFWQEIPDVNNINSISIENGKNKYIKLDKHQIVHFRLHTSDPKYYPYGKSIAAGAVHIFRSLKLMENAMLIYRLSRAPERRIFYVDVGNLPTAKAETFMQKVQERFKKEKFYSANNNDSRHNPLAVDEDFFFPVRNGNANTKVETLPGAQNLGEVDDVKYFRDKLLATLKIPKDYMVEFEKSPERKANLSQLDVKFARVIKRIQDCVAVGLETIAKRHLLMKGYKAFDINSLIIELPDPSDMFTKRKLEIDEVRSRTVTAMLATEMFSKRYIYKTMFDLTDEEIQSLQAELEEEMAAMQQSELGMAQDRVEAGLDPDPQVDQAQKQQELDIKQKDQQIKAKQSKKKNEDVLIARQYLLESKEEINPILLRALNRYKSE